MGFQQGLSGLASTAKQLDVISNNIANATTTGFKASRTEFADVYATAFGGAGNLQPGLGVRVASVSQQFTQGGITITGNPLDVAISGGGFFRLQDANGISYTRAGQFKMDRDGYIVTSDGKYLTGYTNLQLNDNLEVISATNLNRLRVNLNDINAAATDTVSFVMNLNAAEIPATDPNTLITGPFDPTDPGTYHFITSATVYDSLGNSHILNLYYRYEQISAGPPVTNDWEVYATIDGTQVTFNGGQPSHQLQFSTTGALFATTALTSLDPYPIPGAQDLEIDINFTGTTQYTGGSGVNALSQNGYPSGSLVGIYIDDRGYLYGRYSNGVSVPQQQLMLASFRNPQGLIPIGNNQWIATIDAGAETLNTPGEGSAGRLQSGAVEDSNTDLTAELVSLIVAQRLYQANAQSINAQSQILQTLVNLR